MQKENVLIAIKRKLGQEFGTITAAAKHFKVDRSNLSLALNGHLAEIPDYLLNHYGYSKTTTTTYYRTMK